MMDMALFDRVLAINLRGTVDLIRQTLPYLAQNEPEGDDGERGVVVVVSSVAAYEGQVGQLAYSASKGAVASMVLPLAREVGRTAGIRVMGIAPGLFETGMTKPPKKQEQEKKKKKKDEGVESKKKGGGVAGRAGFNPNMIEYPTRMGRGDEFARLVKEIVENPMLNGQVLRLDGAIRMPSRL
jgi:3-hydroxyacyl-CoA dehydrogenase/3-hydroxy-2-methylbutyryl-CoA dehydrogenase